MAKGDDKMTTYFVERKSGVHQQVTVPSSWKVTFGPQNPGVKGGGPTGEPCLRFYESANQQRMVITGVVSFRDMAIKIQEKRTSMKQESFRKDSPDGEKVVVLSAVQEEWVNPDEPKQAGSPEYKQIQEPRISYGPTDFPVDEREDV